ncbi:hypothetical protein IWQ60_000167 [Tieghemiomyces parasiticus]|uniref:Cytochrome P450 n=1 Tax=Tieghemiomyces parasiticus TaxID=78921 RepID=A0A9W8AIZ4_9FUNG|nr:hypothetical protein IWQ60_000167 [Tieghemiomyces parasiticus]
MIPLRRPVNAILCLRCLPTPSAHLAVNPSSTARQVFYSGKWLVYIRDPNYRRQYFCQRDLFDRQLPNSALNGSPLRGFFGDGVLSSHGEAWRRQRRLLAPSFRRTFPAEATVRCSRRLFDVLDHHASVPVDVLHYLKNLLADAVAVKATQSVDSGNNIIASLVESPRTTGEHLSPKEIRDAVNNILFAGHDTTANALAFLLCHTAIHQSVQTQARDEVLAATRTAEDWDHFDEARLAELPYGYNVIKESLRHEPILSVLSNRRLLRDYPFGPYTIPAGSKMGLHIYDVHHNPAHYDDPLAFRPERFGKDRSSSDSQLTWIPFAAGPHQCIGIHFALRKVRVVFALLLYHYEWELPHDSIHFQGLKTVLSPVASARDLRVRFRRRDV